jgi:hypothetical protein
MHPGIKINISGGGELWAQSYFVDTIGNANKEDIHKYVQHQLKVINQGEKVVDSWEYSRNLVACGRLIDRSQEL